MISDKATNTIYFSDCLHKSYPDTQKKIMEVLKAFGTEPLFLPKTKDIWARDFMPIQVTKDKFVEFRFDPDYLQGTTFERREVKTYPDIVCDTIDLKTVKSDIILDGGNVVKSSDTVILTDKIIEENKRDYTKTKLLDKLHELFEVELVILIPWDRECDYGHADGMLRFINDDTVLISGFYNTTEDNWRGRIVKPLKQANLECEWLMVSDKEEQEQNVAYVNFLQTSSLILLPKLNRKEDDIALEQIAKFYPEYASNKRIAQIDMTPIEKKGGALNCISWTIKK